MSDSPAAILHDYSGEQVGTPTNPLWVSSASGANAQPIGITGPVRVDQVGVTGPVRVDRVGITGFVQVTGPIGVTGLVQVVGAVGVTGPVRVDRVGITGFVQVTGPIGVTGPVRVDAVGITGPIRLTDAGGTAVLAVPSFPVAVEGPFSSLGAVTAIAGSTSNFTLLSANANRQGATVYNDTSKDLYVKLGATASTSSFTVKVVKDAYYEVPFGYTGRIDAISASGVSGNVLVTELT